jgi:hypothetical protein
MKCDRCDEPATFHITEVQGEVVTDSHLCGAHARSAGFPFPAEATMVKGAAAQLRQLVDLIRREGRMPTRLELAALGGAGEFAPVDPGTTTFQEQIAYLERVLSFVETQGRFPTEEEVGPDPFLG